MEGEFYVARVSSPVAEIHLLPSYETVPQASCPEGDEASLINEFIVVHATIDLLTEYKI